MRNLLVVASLYIASTTFAYSQASCIVIGGARVPVIGNTGTGGVCAGPGCIPNGIVTILSPEDLSEILRGIDPELSTNFQAIVDSIESQSAEDLAAAIDGQPNMALIVDVPDEAVNIDGQELFVIDPDVIDLETSSEGSE